MTYIGLLHLLLLTLFVSPNLLNKVYYKLGLKEFYLGHQYYMNFIWDSYAKRSKTLDKESRQFVFFGNSITNGLCVESLFQGINMAVSGEILLNAKDKIKEIHNLENKQIVLAYGINDIPRSNEEIMEDYKELVNHLPTSSTIYLSSVLPIDEEAFKKNWDSEKTNKQINQLNQLIQKFCQERPNVIYLNSSKFLFDASGNLDPKLHVGDGIHLNHEGNLLWAKALKETLNNEAANELVTQKEEESIDGSYP